VIIFALFELIQHAFLDLCGMLEKCLKLKVFVKIDFIAFLASWRSNKFTVPAETTQINA